jgi:transcriptional regulator with XRE-family HTH domain
VIKIGTTIRSHRLQKGLSQGDIEKKTGLLRCYLSRVENGHTVPSLDTLSKIALALRRYSPNLNESDRKLLLAMVKKFASTAVR